MKKTLALILALMLSLSAAAALCEADTATVLELNWSDAEEAANKLGGQFYTFDGIALKVWIPDVMINTGLTQEDVDAGYVGYFQTADETAAVGVQYVNAEGMSLEDYAALLAKDGTEVRNVIINGITGLGYDIEKSDTSVVAFATEAGYIIEFSFAPMSNEGFAATALFIMTSIQSI